MLIEEDIYGEKIYNYSNQNCQYWNMNEQLSSYNQGKCPNGINCGKCHGWKELDYHPLNYKKNICPKGSKCTKINKCANIHKKSDEKEDSDNSREYIDYILNEYDTEQSQLTNDFNNSISNHDYEKQKKLNKKDDIKKQIKTTSYIIK